MILHPHLTTPKNRKNSYQSIKRGGKLFEKENDSTMSRCNFHMKETIKKGKKKNSVVQVKICRLIQTFCFNSRARANFEKKEVSFYRWGFRCESRRGMIIELTYTVEVFVLAWIIWSSLSLYIKKIRVAMVTLHSTTVCWVNINNDRTFSLSIYIEKNMKERLLNKK